MNTCKRITLTMLLVISLPSGIRAQLTYPFPGIDAAIPDGSFAGLSDTRHIESNIAAITELKVSLTLSGASAFNGDLYAYVTHDTGFAVLLNRPGRTASTPFGYDDRGLNVVFQDSAVNGDVHNYRLTLSGSAETPLSPPGTLTGTWAPDARNALPSAVNDTTLRSAFLESFSGLPAAGTWTLFIADVSAGGSATLESWGLEITGTPVPEPATTAIVTALGLLAFTVARRVWFRKDHPLLE